MASHSTRPHLCSLHTVLVTTEVCELCWVACDSDSTYTSVRCSSVWSVARMVLTRETRSTGRKHCPIANLYQIRLLYTEFAPLRSIHIFLLTHFFLEWEMLQTEFVQKIKTHILCSVTHVFRKPYRLRDKVEKYCAAGQATDYNMTHAHCMLNT